MAGPFDFDSRDEPDERPRPRRDRDDETSPRQRAGYSQASRRLAGDVSLSIGAFVVIGGGLLGALGLLLPAGFNGLMDGPSVSKVVSARVWIWALGAAAVGGASLRVREVRFPAAGDFMLGGLWLFAALVFGAFLALAGYAVMDRIGNGLGTYTLMLAGLLVSGGAAGRAVEQARKWNVSGETRDDRRPRRTRDDEDERPRRRPNRDEDEDEPPRKRRPARDEDEDEPPRRRPRDEDDEPPPRKRRRRDEDD